MFCWELRYGWTCQRWKLLSRPQIPTSLVLKMASSAGGCVAGIKWHLFSDRDVQSSFSNWGYIESVHPERICILSVLSTRWFPQISLHSLPSLNPLPLGGGGRTYSKSVLTGHWLAGFRLWIILKCDRILQPIHCEGNVLICWVHVCLYFRTTNI